MHVPSTFEGPGPRYNVQAEHGPKRMRHARSSMTSSHTRKTIFHEHGILRVEIKCHKLRADELRNQHWGVAESGLGMWTIVASYAQNMRQTAPVLSTRDE